jgi:hypothetical protein
MERGFLMSRLVLLAFISFLAISVAIAQQTPDVSGPINVSPKHISTDASVKLAEQAMAPITARVTLAVEKFGRVA